MHGGHGPHHTYERTAGAASRPLPPGYRPRRPHETAFYRVIADHLETMLQDARDRSAHGFGLPHHVANSFRRYLACGDLSRGFARVVCRACHYELLVPFSCKVRALCPSCEGRRMADGAARLVDSILPRDVDYRHWTLSFPRWLRARLLRDPSLVSQVLTVFVRAVFAYHRRRARRRGIADGCPSAVTQIQSGGSFANANTHFHTLIPEGVWYEAPDGSVHFHALPPPTDEDVRAITARVVRRVARLIAGRDADPAADDEPDPLANARAEAVQLPMPLGERPALPTRTARHRCAFIDGFSLHADSVVDAADRSGLERLCRYLLRPAISPDRLVVRADGRVEYRFRKPDPTGRTSWVTDGPSWCRRLATLLPPRRSHTTRFHGILSSAHRFRAAVVPVPLTAPEPGPPAMMTLARRLDWAALLRRVWGPDVTSCPRCGAALSVLAFITHPDTTAHILDHLGLTSAPPPIAPARAPPADSLDLTW
jgi:hypothetical protein